MKRFLEQLILKEYIQKQLENLVLMQEQKKNCLEL